MPPTNPDLLTPGEVARLFKVSPSTVVNWADLGKLPSFKTIGGQRRFFRSDVDAFLVAQGLPASGLTDAEAAS